MNININKSNKIFYSLAIVLICWYVVLCFVSYFYQRPLWNDEQAVFQSVEKLTTVQFFTGILENGQVFPRVHLCLIQAISKPFDFSLLSLRFLSFVFMLSAFFVWMRIVRYELKDNFYYFTYVLLWLSSAALIYYCQELKQYSMDVLCSAVFMLFLYNQERIEKQGGALKYSCILFFLPALITFSYIAFFFFVFPLYNLFLSAKEDKSKVKYIVVYLAGLALFSFLVYYFDMRWRRVYGYETYFILTDSVGSFFSSLGEGINNLFSRWLVERPRILKKIILSFFVFGFFNLFGSFFAHIKKDQFKLKSMNTIAFIVFLEMLVMGFLKKYPFTVPRTSLYFAPVILYLTLTGIIALKKFNVYIYKTVYFMFFVLLIFISSQLSYRFLAGDIQFAPVLWWF